MLVLNKFDLQNNDDFEKILGFNYSPEDVLLKKIEKINRKSQLINAATLESITPTDVLIHLIVNQEEITIKSRIIAIGSQQVIVERGYAIPVHCILHVEILKEKQM